MSQRPVAASMGSWRAQQESGIRADALVEYDLGLKKG